MKKVIKLKESDIINIVKQVISEQNNQKSKFELAFDNHPMTYQAYTKDNYLYIETEMGHLYKLGPIKVGPKNQRILLKVEKNPTTKTERFYSVNSKLGNTEIIFVPNYERVKLK